MSTHNPSSSAPAERLNLREHAWPFYIAAMVCGVAGMIAAIALGAMQNDSFKRFFFAYLTSYAFFLAITLGGLFLVILQHLTRAGWAVNLRRIAEWLAGSMPIMAVLAAPIVVSILLGQLNGHGSLYKWSNAAEREHYPDFRKLWLTPAFFLARMAFCFIVWSMLGLWYWKTSTRQDVTGDYRLSEKMQAFAAPAMVLFGLTFTSAAFDFLMSLDAEWASTIFGVYYFAGAALASFSTIIVTVLLLQARGFLRKSVTVEHFHDLGKFLFGFTFFWGYIGFSQFMLYWYANMPEETEWFRRRGATTALHAANTWSYVILALLFGHFLLPFPGLMSRHVKRHPRVLGAWAVWMLAFCWLDVFWMIRPEYYGDGRFDIGLIDLACFLGIGGILVVWVLRKAAHDSLRPLQDPRLEASMTLEIM